MTDDQANAPRGGFIQLMPVRFLAMGIITLGVYAGIQIGAGFGMHLLPGSQQGLALVAIMLSGAAVMLMLYRWLVRVFERRGAQEADFSAGYFLCGLVLGVLLFCAVYAALYALGDARWGGYAGTYGVDKELAVAIIAGVAEEVIFRGVIFRVIENGAGTLVALLISGALFGAIHGANPHASVTSSAAIAIEAGIMLAAAYAYSRNLWLPIGLHMAWNFTEGGVFGAAVSGGAGHGLFHVPLNGPDYLTGGEFGPEASIVAVGVCSLLTVLFLAGIVARGRWRPLHWSWRDASA